ncbi:MAG TPA: NHL repeat-containing protein [Planctomycetota bacterium]
MLSLVVLLAAQDPVLLPPVREIGVPDAHAESPLEPRSSAFGKGGRLYVVDAGAHRVLIYGADGRSAGAWGKFGAAPGELAGPSGVAVGPDGEVFVADAGNGRVQIFDPDGRFLFQFPKDEPLVSPADVSVYGDRVFVPEPDRRRVRVFGLRGEPRLTLGAELLGRPTGAAADEKGDIYVADAGAHRIQKFKADGAPLTSWGAWGEPPGYFRRPGGLAWSAGKLLVADSGNHRIQVFDADGRLTRLWGAGPVRPGQGGGHLHAPSHVAVAPDGAFAAVAEPVEGRVQIFPYRDAPPGTPWAGLPWWERMHAKPAIVDPAAPKPPGLSALVAVADRDSHAVFFVDVTENTVSRVIARAGGYGPRLGQFNDPVSVAFDVKSLKAWVSDAGHRRIQLLALARVPGRPFEAGSDARAVAAWDFGGVPGALALDARGRLYALDPAKAEVVVFDTKDMTRLRVLRAPALKGPSRWDGLGAAPDGKRVYVADGLGCRVLVFDESGAPVAEWGRRGAEPEAFLRPGSVAADAAGQVHVLDVLLCEGKTFDADGRFLRRWSGPGPRPTQLRAPAWIAFGPPDHLVVDDAGNHLGQVFRTDGRSAGFFIKAGFPLLGGGR